MTAEQHLEEGYRFDAHIVDMDDKGDDHRAVLEFPTNDRETDSYKTGWRSGVFDASFKKRMPVMLFNHNPDMLIGSAVEAESLGDRARVINRFADFAKVPKAEEAHSLMADGHFPGASFHFRNARSVAHPNVRGARLFVQADMLETSPVVFPSIVGAKITEVRSQEEGTTLETPTLEEIFALHDRHVLDDDGLRAMIADHYPTFREHIRVASPAEPTVEERVAVLLGAEHGLRDLTIHIGSDGTVSTSGADTAGGGDGGSDDDAADLAQATDAALDEACRLFTSVDTTGLPDEVQQGIALAQAAGVAVDELLETLGLADPDEPGGDDGGERAALTAEEEKKLSDSDFAYVNPDGGRHLPIHDPAHVRNALARFDQTHFDSDDAKKKAKAKIDAAAKKMGVGQEGSRSGDEGAPPPEEEPAAAVVPDEAINSALARLERY